MIFSFPVKLASANGPGTGDFFHSLLPEYRYSFRHFSRNIRYFGSQPSNREQTHCSRDMLDLYQFFFCCETMRKQGLRVKSTQHKGHDTGEERSRAARNKLALSSRTNLGILGSILLGSLGGCRFFSTEFNATRFKPDCRDVNLGVDSRTRGIANVYK